MTHKEAVNWIINITADIGKIQHQDLWHYGQALSEIKEMLKQLPSAQRTGRWIIEDKYIDHRTERCSACGFVANRSYIQDIWHYCPRCGAKMEVEHETD